MTNKPFIGDGDVSTFYSIPPLHKQHTKPLINKPLVPPCKDITSDRKQSIHIRMLKQQAGLE